MRCVRDFVRDNGAYRSSSIAAKRWFQTYASRGTHVPRDALSASMISGGQCRRPERPAHSAAASPATIVMDPLPDPRFDSYGFVPSRVQQINQGLRFIAKPFRVA